MTNSNKLIKKTKVFLGLMKKFHLVDVDIESKHEPRSAYSLQFSIFKKTYVPLLNIIYIFEFLKLRSAYNDNSFGVLMNRVFYFYAKLSKTQKNNSLSGLNSKTFHTQKNNNVVVFSKPYKQLFLIFFKKQPLFIFTSGLMRIVMNEKRKSSKKLYKVAVSLIKLALILLIKKNYFDNCYLKLINVGQLRSKILMTFTKHKIHNIVSYVFFKLNNDKNSQKFKTRRAIKKYVKKRFKLNT
jgi:hypothetical protein